MGINVLQLTLSFRPGGRKNAIKALSRGLNDTGTRCDLCCLDELGCDQAELSDLFRTVTVLGRQQAGYRALARRLHALCRDREVDLIHAHDAASQFIGSLVRLVRPRVRLVMTFHRSLGFESARRRDRLRNAASGWLTQAVVTGSSERRSHFLSENHVPPRKVVVIPFGIDTEAFRLDPRAREEIRARLGIRGETVVVGAVGHFGSEKGIDRAIEAFNEFRRRTPDADAVLVVLGDGTPRQREAIARQASGVPGGGVVLAGFQPDRGGGTRRSTYFSMPPVTNKLFAKPIPPQLRADSLSRSERVLAPRAADRPRARCDRGSGGAITHGVQDTAMTPYDVSTTSDPFGSVPPNFRKGAKPTWHQRRRHRTVLSLLRGLSGRVLDYGCGYGDLTHAISRTHAVVGCDVDPQRVAFARREYAPLEFVECPPDGAPYEDASFDVVVSSVVIPFVPDPAEYLGRIHRLLRDRGHLILVTANEPVVQNAFRRVLGRSKAVARLWIPPLAEVRSLVTNCGFDVIDSTFFYDPPGDGWKNGSDYVIGGIEQVLSVVGVGRTAHYHAYLAVKR